MDGHITVATWWILVLHSCSHECWYIDLCLLFAASRTSVLHCPKCDSHFVIEVSDKTGLDLMRDSLTQSTCVKSLTMSKLDQDQSFSRSKDPGLGGVFLTPSEESFEKMCTFFIGCDYGTVRRPPNLKY